MTDARDFEIVIGPIGHQCHVKVNGEPVRAYKVVITAEVNEATTIELHCFGPRHEPIIVKGRMIDDE